jgi:hypothetical protein
MFDVREDRHNELIEDKERKILDIGYKLASEISKTEQQSEENAKLHQLVATAETRLGTEVFGHSETKSRLKLLEQQKDQLLSRLNVEQERIKKFHVSENALKEKYDLVEQLREAKDLQDFQQAQIDTLKDSTQFSASNIKTLEMKLKGLERRGNRRSKTPRMEDVEETGLQEDLSADTIESQIESANVMPKDFEGDGHSLKGNDEALDPAAPNTRGANFQRELAGLQRKWNIALGCTKSGRERMQQLREWLQTTNKGIRWWRTVLTLIESSESVRQAVQRINKTVYERRAGNGWLSGARGTRNRFSLFEVMTKDLKTTAGVLAEELKKKGDAGKCRGERESWQKKQ